MPYMADVDVNTAGYIVIVNIMYLVMSVMILIEIAMYKTSLCQRFCFQRAL